MVQKSGDHQLRLVGYPIIYHGFYTSQVVQDFFHQHYCKLKIWHHIKLPQRFTVKTSGAFLYSNCNIFVYVYIAHPQPPQGDFSSTQNLGKITGWGKCNTTKNCDSCVRRWGFELQPRNNLPGVGKNAWLVVFWCNRCYYEKSGLPCSWRCIYL